jgi:hypothetical protein
MPEMIGKNDGLSELGENGMKKECNKKLNLCKLNSDKTM